MNGDLWALELRRWHGEKGRHDLPWQRPATAYRVWVSEIMLQQTRVDTVLPFFERFVGCFPDIPTLAAAPLDEVLRLWSGLGFYVRARNLHRAAKIMVERCRGSMPETVEQLRYLPGIGRSTAGAIHSLAFGGCAPILDGNVKRVFARCFAVEGTASALERKLWLLAENLAPRQDCGIYNQALMDLGSSVCRPWQPSCDQCPLQSSCLAFKAGNPEAYPQRAGKKARPHKTHWLLLLRGPDGGIRLERRPPAGIWGGLWAPPEFSRRQDGEAWLAERGWQCLTLQPLPPLKTAFSHFELEMRPLLCDIPAGFDDRIEDGGALCWYKEQEFGGGLPAPVERLLRQTP